MSERTAGSFGGPEWHGDSGQRKPSRRLLESEAQRKRKDAHRFCCVFFIFLVTIPFMFVLFYHTNPTTILFLTILVMLLSFIPLFYNSGEIVTATPVGPLLSSTMLACCMASFLGTLRCYYGHVQPMRELITGRQYNGVYPQFPATAFGDASFVTFANRTVIDKSNALGMKSLQSGFNTFCVAPITNPSDTGRMEFWAVGADCCSDNGSDFNCDDASHVGANNAWVLREPSDVLYDWLGKHIAPATVRRDIFLQAISQAGRVHQITTSEDAILVRWTKESKQNLIWSEIKLVLLAMSLIVVGAILMAMLLTRLNMRYTDLRHLQYQKKYGTKLGEGDMSARLLEFLDIVNEETQELEMHVESFRPKLNKYDTCLLGVVVPFVVFFSCLVLTSYGGCMRYGAITTAFFGAIFTTMILSLLMTKNRVINGLCIMLCALAGLHIGFVNYENNMFQYCSIEDGRTYANVMPDSSAEEYTDAGKMNFASSAQLSQNHSVGYFYQDVTYCVAPILSQKAPCFVAAGQPNSNSSNGTSTALLEWKTPILLQTASRMHKSTRSGHEDHIAGAIVEDGVATMNGKPDRAISALQRTAVMGSTDCDDKIEFWAMGIDCCDARGSFRCDDAEDDSARAAIIVHPFSSYLPHLCRWMSMFPESVCDSMDAERDGSLAGSRRQLLNAVDQSVAANGLTAPESVVFLRWGKNADDLQGVYKSRSLGIVAITSMIALVLMLGISALDHFYVKYERQVEDKWVREHAQNESQKRAGQTDFFAKARESLRV